MVETRVELPVSTQPVKMSASRRRQNLMRISSSPVTTVDAQGTAYLCFPEDHSWFQGNISTDDESNYSLYGERITVPAQDKVDAAVKMAENLGRLSLTESDEENNNGASDEEIEKPAQEPTTFYRVTLIDHFSGLKHKLPLIHAKKLKGFTTGQFFASEHKEVTFEVENVYKGQKADIMIHRYVGSSQHLRGKCFLYTGQINILFDEMVEGGPSWFM